MFRMNFMRLQFAITHQRHAKVEAAAAFVAATAAIVATLGTML